MAFRRYVAWTLFFVVAVAAAFTMYQVADLGGKAAAREPDSVTNESIVMETDIWQFVNKAVEANTAGFNETVSAENASGTDLEKGEDFEWNATEGKIKFLNTQNVTDGATGSINYTYFRNTERVGELDAVLGPVVSFVGQAGIWGAGLALVGILLALAALVAKFFGGDDFQSNR